MLEKNNNYIVATYNVQIFINFIGVWSNWSECTVTCGNGTKFRNRSCITDCENGTTEYKECYKNCCPGNKIAYIIDVLSI